MTKTGKKKDKLKPSFLHSLNLNHPVLKHSRFSKVNLAIFILVFAGIGGYILLSSNAATTTANIFVSANGSDTGTNCKRFATPTTNPDPVGTSLCASFNKAYQLASCGDSVEVETGNYPAQTVHYDSSKDLCNSTTRVKFNAVSGSPVNLSGLSFGLLNEQAPSHIEVRGITISSQNRLVTWANGSDYLFSNITAPWIDIAGTSAVTVEDSNIGNCIADGTSNCVSKVTAQAINNTGTIYSPQNIAFNQVTFHDVTSSDIAQYHTECLYILAGSNINVKNSKFYHCQIYDIGLAGTQGTSPPGIHGVEISNNWFGKTYGDSGFTTPAATPVSLDVRYAIENVQFKFNSFFEGTSADTGGVSGVGGTDWSNVTGTVFIGNLMRKATGNCMPNATYAYNILVQFNTGWSTAGCGPGDIVQPFDQPNFGYVNNADLPAGDWHLVSDSPARALVAKASCIDSDIDGNLRSQTTACDAGADEYAQPAGLANIFVAANGSDTGTNCKRFAAAASNPDPSGASLCASFNKAYKLALPGDTVLVVAGDYPFQAIYPDSTKNIPDGSCSITPTSQNLSACITFLPASGRPVVKGLTVLSPGTRFLNIDVADAGVGASWKDNPSGVTCKGGVQPHDIIFDGIHNYVSGGVPQPGKAPGANASAGAVYNVAFVNSDFGPFYDSVGTGQFSNSTQAASTYCAAYPAEQLKDKNILLFNNTWHDLYQTAVSNGTNCGSDPAQYFCNHMECIHWRASNSWIINNRFINCAQNDVSVQTFGVSVPVIDNLQIIGNVFDRPCSNQPAPCGVVSAMPIICSSGTDLVTNITIAYNSIWGSPGFQKDSCTNPTPFAGAVVVGNVFRYNSTNFSCTSYASVGVNLLYNIWANGSTVACDPTNHILTTSTFPWVHPDAPDYNFALIDGSEAENFVPTSVTSSGRTITCPSKDIAGILRPKLGVSRCAAGAYETSFAGSSSPIAKPGDVNGDSRVDLADLSILLSHYGQSATVNQGDLSNDGRVTLIDLSILLSNYGM